ncbi:two-component system regulatory protein YycI [Alicyclobacillus sp. SO9]|uniref:two-component system regulatory protein YycI n=1 Tax=Alicyclobacillus sp. SO9 TaxID=2665646 RepID=UPI0018E7A654|nr:two-component system regulatory protein YycI [Alicyclobacillus sp. SO9]QQE78929.1 two-component system regulatory protein YycI [Alicyclobacillus sp. SO9]
MNWETAKTWLIVVFLLLDLLLGWQYVQSRQATKGYIESRTDLIANTKTLLAQHDFSLKASIPQTHPNLPSLKAKTANLNLHQLAKQLFPNAKSFSFNQQAGIVNVDKQKIKINEPGTWTVTLNPPKQISNSDNAALLALSGNKYKQDATLTGTHNWIFEENFQGLPMFDAPLDVQHKNGAATGFQQTLYSNVQVVGTPKPTISALDALNSLANNTVDKSSQGQDNVIQEIDLGYALKAPSNVSSSTVSSNYWFPVWRIVTVNNVYYINAFTGEIETPS